MQCFRDLFWQSHDRLRLYSRIYDGPHDAPTVLCLPSLRRNCRDFEELAPHLQRHYRVVAPDLRGRGQSARDRRATNYQPNTSVHDLLQLLSVLGARHVSILGTAQGGILGMMLAQAQPGRVRALILNDIGPAVDPAGGERAAAQMCPRAPAQDWAEATQRLRDSYGAAWPGLSPARWLELTRRTYREDAYGRVIDECDPLVAEVNAPLHAVASDLWPLWQALASLPTLCIRGAHSDILGEASFARMQAERAVQTLTVPDRGHFPLLDESGVPSVIDEFLAKNAH